MIRVRTTRLTQNSMANGKHSKSVINEILYSVNAVVLLLTQSHYGQNKFLKKSKSYRLSQYGQNFGVSA